MKFDPRLFGIEADIWKAAVAASFPIVSTRPGTLPSAAQVASCATVGDRAVEEFRKRVACDPFDPSVWDEPTSEEE